MRKLLLLSVFLGGCVTPAEAKRNALVTEFESAYSTCRACLGRIQQHGTPAACAEPCAQVGSVAQLALDASAAAVPQPKTRQAAQAAAPE